MAAITLDDILSGKIDLSKDQKKAIKAALGITDSGESDRGDGSLKEMRAKIEYGREYYEILQKTAEQVGDLKAAREAESDIIKNQMADFLIQEGHVQGITEATQAINDLLAGQDTALSNNLDAMQGLVDLRLEDLRTMDKTEKGVKKYGQSADKVFKEIGESIGVINVMNNDFIKGILQLGNALEAGGEDGEQAALAIKESFQKTFSVTNLLASVVTKIVEQTIATAVAADKAQSAFAAATGAGRSFSDAIQSAGQYAMGYGVSMEEAGKSAEALYSGTTNFVNLSKDMKAQMIANTAELEKIGVSAAEAGEIFQFMNLNLGMTATQSLDATNQLAMMGTELGISSKQMTKDFTQAMGSLAVYGPRAVGVFKNLAGAAKVAGVETSKLLSIAGKFDTFQGSAETVGKLNALLGTQLSTTQMLMQTEDERIETLIGTIQAQGTAFKDMDRFQQKAVAAAAGIDDMNEAQRIFGMNLSQYGEYQQEMSDASDAQNKLNEAIRGTQTVTNKLKAIAAEFIVEFQPMLEMLHEVLKMTLDWFNTFSPEAKRRIMAVILAVAGLTLAIKVIGPIISATTAIMGAAGGAAGAAGTGMIGSLSAMGTAAGRAIIPLAKLGAILAGVYLAFQAVKAAGRLFEPGPEPSQAEKEAEGVIKYKSAITPQVSADIANLALISAGRAKDAITDAFVMAQKIDFKANFEGIFPETVQLVMEDGTKFNTYVAKITNV